MKIKKGDTYFLNDIFGKVKAKVIRIVKNDNGEIVIKYHMGFPFYFRNEISGESFRNRLLKEVDEVEI